MTGGKGKTRVIGDKNQGESVTGGNGKTWVTGGKENQGN